jgi:hypothetical protein
MTIAAGKIVPVEAYPAETGPGKPGPGEPGPDEADAERATDEFPGPAAESIGSRGGGQQLPPAAEATGSPIRETSAAIPKIPGRTRALLSFRILPIRFCTGKRQRTDRR